MIEIKSGAILALEAMSPANAKQRMFLVIRPSTLKVELTSLKDTDEAFNEMSTINVNTGLGGPTTLGFTAAMLSSYHNLVAVANGI